MEKRNGKRFTDYYTVTKGWIGNKVLCNELQDIDPSIYDNFRFDIEDENGNQKDIYQWFITDCNENDVEWLEKSFGLLFTYSELLDKYVLCVDHFGTMWKGVEVKILNDDIADDTIEYNEKKWR